MTVVVDTNSLVGMMGQASPSAALKQALEEGRLDWAVSTPVLLEYEEVICRLAGVRAWEKVARMLEVISQLRGTLRMISPSFRFRTITGDPDDDAFAGCAIVADADWIVTEDHHFEVLQSAGYKPRPITPAEFIERFLAGD